MAPEEPSLRVTDKLAHPELGYVRLPPVNIAVFVSINFYVITMNFSCLFLSQSGMGDLRVCEYRPGDIPVIHPLFKGEESILCGDDGLIFRHMAELVRTDNIAAGIDVRGGGPKGGIGPDPLQGVFNSGILKREAFDIRLSSDSHEDSLCLDLLCLVFSVLQGQGDPAVFHTELQGCVSGEQVYPVFYHLLRQSVD